MKSRKYESEDAAFEHLRSIGQLEFFGRGGLDYDYCVCTLTIDGISYKLFIYRDGNVILKD